MLYLNNLSSHTSAQSINRVLKSVDMPDTTLERLLVFEDIIIDAFLHTLVGDRSPLLVTYLDTLFAQHPKLRLLVKNQLGQLGIKALAGVPTVMLKGFDSDIVARCLPGLIPMLLHHLLEVASDKVESDTLSQLLNIPPNFSADFALFAYDMLGGRPFDSLQADAIHYLDNLTIHEIDLTTLDDNIARLLNLDQIRSIASAHHIPSQIVQQLELCIQNPIKFMLLLNLVAIEIATHHFDNAYVWSDANLMECEVDVPFSEFRVQALCARYFAVTITDDPGYGLMDITQAIETRADSILTNYTMTAVISALAVADTDLHKQIDAEHAEIQNLIHHATRLIGLANDCGTDLMHMSAEEIKQEVHKLRQLYADPRPQSKDNPIADLHRQAKDGALDDDYLALFPLIKDIAKGERNLALDCRFDPNLDGWDTVADNLILLAQAFQQIQDAFNTQSEAIHLQKIVGLIDNFVQYNFQIYALGADYDHRKPVIEQLDIMK